MLYHHKPYNTIILTKDLRTKDSLKLRLFGTKEGKHFSIEFLIEFFVKYLFKREFLIKLFITVSNSKPRVGFTRRTDPSLFFRKLEIALLYF